MSYQTIELKPATSAGLDFDLEPYYALTVDKICQASLNEEMMPLTETAMHNEHLYGMAMVGSWVTPRGNHIQRVLSYAAVTGFVEHPWGKLAEVGSVITLPEERLKGYGTSVVGMVLKLASTKAALAEHGHTGFIAKCNVDSVGMFAGKLGFSQEGNNEAGQAIMLKHL